MVKFVVETYDCTYRKASGEGEQTMHGAQDRKQKQQQTHQCRQMIRRQHSHELALNFSFISSSTHRQAGEKVCIVVFLTWQVGNNIRKT